MLLYTVSRGDTLQSISTRFDVSVAHIRCNNQLAGDTLATGQVLVIRYGPLYTVREGDTLFSVATRFQTSIEVLLRLNPQIVSPDVILPGSELVLYKPTKREPLSVNAYGYTHVSCGNLSDALPHLSYFSIFSYDARPDGSLAPIRDQWLIQTAMLAGVTPRMVVTNIDAVTGNFSSELASILLNDRTVQDKLMDNVLHIVKSRCYAGVDIDFEYVYPRDRQAFNSFLQRMSVLAAKCGFTLSTAVAAKTGDSDSDILSGGHDYAAHGRYCDQVILMTYEWGYAYGEAQAVAPLNKVAEVLDYATSVIPPKKILMGIPAYGYDWPVPQSSATPAKAISAMAARDLAIRKGARIQFDRLAQAPFFTYTDDQSAPRIVWFEDAASIQSKLELARKYKLGGVSYWALNFAFPENWAALNSMATVRGC